MRFDVDSARRDGYSDSDIAGALAARAKFDLAAARRDGYTDTEIVGFLAKPGGSAAPPKPLAGTMDAELEAMRPQESAAEAPAAPTADWGDVARSLPGQFVAGTRSAAANLRRMAAEESVTQREEALSPARADPSGWGALVKARAVARQGERLESDRAALSGAEADAAQARRDMGLVTPEDMTIAQEALSSLAQSSGPTLLGLAAGILTRNVPLAFAIAGGGGAASQAGSTYGEARDEHGATHREASVAAAIDAVLEGGGEMLPLGYALKPGTPVFKRIFGTLAREAGQESVTQFAQDLRAMAMENPNLTMGQVWRNLQVAALAGAGGGAVYGGAGAAANASRERAARREMRTQITLERIDGAQDIDVAIAAVNDATRADRDERTIATAIASAQAELEAEDQASMAAARRPPGLIAGAMMAEPATAKVAESSDIAPVAAPEALPPAVEPSPAAAVNNSERTALDAAGEAPRSTAMALAFQQAQERAEQPAAPAQPDVAGMNELQLRVASLYSSDPALRRTAADELSRRAPAPAAVPAGEAATVDAAAHQAASSPTNDLPEPSRAQIDANNARLGHARIGGLNLSIENPAGSIREDKANVPPKWRTEMRSHYGYIRGTTGFDKDHLDVFVKPSTAGTWSGTVYVVNQNKANGNFDEHKAIIGATSEAEARALYLENYEPGWQRRIRSITPMPLAQFRAWAHDQTAAGPRGGAVERVRIFGRDVATLNKRELEVASERGATAAQRAAAASVLEQRAGTTPQRAEAPAKVFGRSVDELNESELSAVARAGSAPAKASARAEMGRRAERVSAGQSAQAIESPDRSSEEAAEPAALPTRLPTTQAEKGAEAEADPAAEREAVGIAMTPRYSVAADGEQATASNAARPDAIRQAVRDLFRVPLNEGRFNKSRDTLGIYKVKPRTIRVRNQNDIGVIAHELGHHLSETSRPIRAARQAFDDELRQITPYAAQQTSVALQREEGMAEFFRFYLMQPTQAKAKAPGFFKAFEGYVDEKGLKPAIDEVAGAIRDWQNLPPADRILAKVGEAEPDFRKRFNLDRVIFEVFDRWLPLKNMVADLRPDIAPSADPFKLAHLLAGDAAIIEDWLLRESIPFNFERRADLDDRGKALAEILKPVMEQQREFGAYLIAKRANELMRRGKEHLYSQDEIAAGLRLETPEFKAAAKELYRYQDRLLDYAVEGGLLTAGAARAFRQHPFYVPFFRVGERLGQRGGSVFREIRGGTENLRDPIANIIENTVRVIHATNRNYVLAKAHDLARSVPGGGRWLEDVPIPEKAVKLETEKIIEQLREQGVEISTEAAEALATVQTFFVKNPFGDDQDRVIVIRRSGRPYALQVNDEMLWQALERFEPVDMGFLEKLLAVPADVLRTGIVLSPEFMARNVARDMLSGFVQSKAGILPVAGTLNGFKEVATRSDAARLYRAFGGAYGDMWRADSGLERALVERMARRGGFDPATIVTPRGLIALLHRLGSVTEAGTRVAEFKKSKGDGTVDELIDAAYNAREVSVDFGMHGHSRMVRFLTRITPFMNPALQGWYKAARTAKTQPFATVLRGGMLAAASIFLYLNNRDEDWYDEIEQWERNTYWHLDVGLRDKAGQVIPARIPKPFEWGGFFGSIPEALAQVAIDQHGKRFAKRLASIVDDVFMIRTIPTALLVPAELWANKNQFTGRQIVPEHRERLAPELQSTAGTSLTARKIGELADVAPAKLDHAVRGLFGTLGTYTVMLADQALRASGEDPAALPLPWQRAPVARVFFHDPSGANSRQVSEFYELLREARRADSSLKYMEPERMADYYAKHRAAIEHRRSADKVARFMADLRKENEQLRKSRDLPDMERASMIIENNRQIRWLARDFMKDYKTTTGAP